MTIQSTPQSIVTERLLLRRWRDSDLTPFAALNSDDEVMRYFPAKLSREETAAMIERIETGFDQNAFGLWAVEERDGGDFVGFVGLSKPKFEAHFTPCVEIGWRLAKHHWGKGFALEAARASMADGYKRIGLDEIVSFTARINERSIKVMQRLKMQRREDEDFLHPVLAPEHALALHVLYRLGAAEFAANNKGETFTYK